MKRRARHGTIDARVALLAHYGADPEVARELEALYQRRYVHGGPWLGDVPPGDPALQVDLLDVASRLGLSAFQGDDDGYDSGGTILHRWCVLRHEPARPSPVRRSS